MARIVTLILAVSLSACTQFPQLDAAVSDRARSADYPSLIPAERIAAKRDSGGRLQEGDGEALLARADRLHERGRILRGLPVVDEAARLRFASVLKRLGG